MLDFLRFACLSLTLAAALPAQAQPSAAPAPEPAAAAPAAQAVEPAPPAPAPRPFQVDPPGLDDLKPGPPDPAAGESLLGSLVKLVLVLGLVLALVYVSLNWGLRKLMRLGPARGAVVKVHERVPLDAKKTVYLVEAGGEFLLLGAGEREVSFLTRLEPEQAKAALANRVPPQAPASAGKPFWERLLVKPPPKDPGGAQGGPAPT